jgi:adenylate cyclase
MGADMSDDSESNSGTSGVEGAVDVEDTSGVGVAGGVEGEAHALSPQPSGAPTAATNTVTNTSTNTSTNTVTPQGQSRPPTRPSVSRMGYKIPIVAKLVGVTVALLLIATVSIALRSSDLFERISGPREKDANGVAAEAKAAQINLILERHIQKAQIIGSLLLKTYATDAERTEALSLSFYQDLDFVGAEVVALKDGRPTTFDRISKDDYFRKLELPTDYLEQLRVAKPFPLTNVFNGSVEILNSSLPNGAPLLTLGVPFGRDELERITHVALVDVRLESVQKPFARVTDRSFFMVGKDGSVLAHPDEKLVFEGKTLKDLDVVQKALSSRIAKGETRYVNPSDKKTFIASYAQTNFGPAVIAQASEEIILEPARFVRREAFFVTGLVLSGAVFFIFLFSMSLTSPIEKLVEVTRQVAAGNFDVQSNVTSHDEVGELAKSFDTMVSGLKERDKMKNVLNKFHGSSITEDLMKGDLALGGKKKRVTVFFSDIRDFTKFSEGHTPEEVVEMLNEYFEIMVGIVTRNHGVVDKFVGDAMMAIWGAPNTTGQDEWYALKACLEMRAALEKLNELRVGRGQTEIKIGMGLNSGDAISGTIGSSERMEYTVIGDTVNTASRVESSTKAFGTDLLVSEETLAAVEGRFLPEFAGAAEVKGKAEPLKMFKVRGYVDEAGQEVVVRTKYSDYEAGEDPKVTKLAG